MEHKCVVPDCSEMISDGQGCGCPVHDEEASVLVAGFGSGVPGDGEVSSEE